MGHLPLAPDAARRLTSRPCRWRAEAANEKEEIGWRAHRFPRPERTGSSSAAGAGDKGLKKNAIGFVSSVVIGVASTAPGYSLAATLGFIAAAVGLGSPAILLISFVPMFLVAGSYYYMNKADPDCGTSFSWVTKGMGPHLGWIVGWMIVVTDIVVMANLAQIAGLYTFELFGWEAAAELDRRRDRGRRDLDRDHDRDRACYGIELSARTQVGLLGGRDLHPGAVRDRRPGQGLRRRRRTGLRSTRASPGSTPSPSARAK